jgi:hypothetical protein
VAWRQVQATGAKRKLIIDTDKTKLLSKGGSDILRTKLFGDRTSSPSSPDFAPYYFVLFGNVKRLRVRQ